MLSSEELGGVANKAFGVCALLAALPLFCLGKESSVLRSAAAGTLNSA